MFYPKECYSINETNTKIAKKAYEDQQNRMYAWIETNYPNYYSLDLQEKMRIRQEYKERSETEMKSFKELPGYMANKFVKDEHIFIPGKGSFYETKENAIAIYNNLPGSGNGVKCEIETAIIEGVTVYNCHETNVFD
jgi:hypothetical protein